MLLEIQGRKGELRNLRIEIGSSADNQTGTS